MMKKRRKWLLPGPGCEWPGEDRGTHRGGELPGGASLELVCLLGQKLQGQRRLNEDIGGNLRGPPQGTLPDLRDLRTQGWTPPDWGVRLKRGAYTPMSTHRWTSFSYLLYAEPVFHTAVPTHPEPVWLPDICHHLSHSVSLPLEFKYSQVQPVSVLLFLGPDSQPCYHQLGPEVCPHSF